MEPKEVADAVIFMLTRPRNVVIRNGHLPNSDLKAVKCRALHGC